MKKKLKSLIYIAIFLISFIGVFQQFEKNGNYYSDAYAKGRGFHLDLFIKKYEDNNVDSKLFSNPEEFPFRYEDIYKRFGRTEEEEKMNFLNYFINNYGNPEKRSNLNDLKKLDSIKPLEGACFRIYVLKNEKMVKDFSENPNKYATSEEIEKYVRENSISGDDIGYLLKTNFEHYNDPNVIVDIFRDSYYNITKYTPSNVEETFKGVRENEFFTDENGIIRLYYAVDETDIRENVYLWIIETKENSVGKAKTAQIGVAEPMAFQINELANYQPISKSDLNIEERKYLLDLKEEEHYYNKSFINDTYWYATLYAKNTLYNTGSEKNIDLVKTANINGKINNPENITSTYTLGLDDVKSEYMSNNVTFDGDYINWVINSYFEKDLIENIESIEVVDYIDSYLDIGRNDKIGVWDSEKDSTDKIDVDVSLSKKNSNGEVVTKKLKPGEYTCSIEKNQENERTSRGYRSDIKLKIKIENPNKYFKNIDGNSSANLKVNLGTYVKDDSPVGVCYYNDHDTTFKKIGNSGTGKVESKDPIPVAHRGYIHVRKIDRETEETLSGAEFILLREVDRNIYKGNPGDPDYEYNYDTETVVEYLTEDGKFQIADQNVKFKYNEKTKEWEQVSGDEVSRPKIFTTDENGDFFIKGVQEVVRYANQPMRMNYEFENVYDVFEDKSEIKKSNSRSAYYLREIKAPEGYSSIREKNVSAEVASILKEGMFNFKMLKNDLPLYVHETKWEVRTGPGINTEGPKVDLEESEPERPDNPHGEYVMCKIAYPNHYKMLPNVGKRGLILFMLAGAILATVSMYYLIKRRKERVS